MSWIISESGQHELVLRTDDRRHAVRFSISADGNLSITMHGTPTLPNPATWPVHALGADFDPVVTMYVAAWIARQYPLLGLTPPRAADLHPDEEAEQPGRFAP